MSRQKAYEPPPWAKQISWVSGGLSNTHPGRQVERHLAELAGAEGGTVVFGTHLVGSNVLIYRTIVAIKIERPFPDRRRA